MKVLLTGASGFIGSRLLHALVDAGCEVVCAGRRRPDGMPSQATWFEIDFNRAMRPDDWAKLLADVDVIVNAVGILRESPEQTFDAVHRDAACALFTAGARARVAHIVQISALGADDKARSRYHLSKKAADDCLLALGVRASIVQPSLVYGPGGSSATLFETFASLPLIPVPGTGEQQIQPVHIDDLVSALLTLVLSETGVTRHVPMVGPVATSLRNFYADLRAAMGISRRARILGIPMSFMRLAAQAGKNMRHALLDPETLDMLERGNVANPAEITALLGRAPRSAREFIQTNHASAVADQARLRWLLPMLRVSIALVWLVTGVVSFGLYPTESSLALLARAGVPAAVAPLFLYGAASLDIALGVLTLLPRRRRWLWPAQASLMVLYTVIITVRLPEFWLHPYGPILKNIPMLALIWLLYEMEDRRWTTSS